MPLGFLLIIHLNKVFIRKGKKKNNQYFDNFFHFSKKLCQNFHKIDC